MKKILFLIFTILSLHSCNKQGERKIVKINLDEEKIAWSKISDIMQIDTLFPISSKNFYIGACKKIVLDNDMVYLWDGIQNIIFSYNMSGRELSPFIDKRGNAKSEYIEISDFVVTEAGEIAIFDSEKCNVIFYTKSGDYIRTVNVSHGSSLSITPDNKIFINNGQLDGDHIISAYDKDGKILQEIPARNDLPNYLMQDLGSICATKDGVFYVTPFDFTVYRLDSEGVSPYISFDFGKNAYSLEKDKWDNTKAIAEYVMKTQDKVFLLQSLNYYNGIFIFSTDLNHQIFYDYNSDRLVQLSNLESPYNIIFSSPIYCNSKGDFWTSISNGNVCNALLPYLSVEKTGIKAIDKIHNDEQANNILWIVKGHIKKDSEHF